MEIGVTEAVQERVKKQRLVKARILRLCFAGIHI